MTDTLSTEKFVIMVVYNAIQYDARVIRAAEVINNLGEKVKVISFNSDLSYKNDNFESISYNTRNIGKFSLFKFWLFVIKFSIKWRREIKLVYLHDYFLCGLGQVLSLITGAKWVYDAHELLIERKSKKIGLRKLFFLLLEKINIKYADLVIAANQERERIMKNVYKLKNTSFVLNIASHIALNEDYDLFDKEDYIVYQGYMSKDRNIDDYIALLIKLPTNIKLKIIGGGPDLEYYKKMVSELNLTHRVKFTGLIPYSRLIEESRSCKIGIVSYSLNGLNNYYCSPNKLYEYSQMNIPMIFSPQPFLIKISKNYGIGEVIYKDMTTENKSKLIEDMFSNISVYRENLCRFNSDFSFDNEALRLRKNILNLLK